MAIAAPPLPDRAVTTAERMRSLATSANRIKCLGLIGDAFGAERECGRWFYTTDPVTNRFCPECQAEREKLTRAPRRGIVLGVRPRRPSAFVPSCPGGKPCARFRRTGRCGHDGMGYRPLPPVPDSDALDSAGRVDVMRKRLALGYGLYHEDDIWRRSAESDGIQTGLKLYRYMNGEDGRDGENVAPITAQDWQEVTRQQRHLTDQWGDHKDPELVMRHLEVWDAELLRRRRAYLAELDRREAAP